MGTTNAPFGLRPVRHSSGMVRATSYKPGAKATAAAIYQGDPVKAVMDGTDWLAVAAAADAIIGVFAGCSYIDANGKPTLSNFWPGSTTGATNIEFFVYDDPDTIFEAQADTTVASTYTNAIIGDGAPIIYAAGSSVTGISAVTLGILVGAAAPTGVRFVERDLSDLGGTGFYDATYNPYPVVRCKIAKHQFVAVINNF